MNINIFFANIWKTFQVDSFSAGGRNLYQALYCNINISSRNLNEAMSKFVPGTFKIKSLYLLSYHDKEI